MHTLRRPPLLLVGIILVAIVAWLAGSQASRATRVFERFYHHGLKLVTITSGLGTAWSLAFLPDGHMLLTEREGRLRLIPPQGGPGVVVSGLPAMWIEAEGGLYSVLVDPGFAANHLIYWNYAEAAVPSERGSSVAVAVGRLDGTALTQVHVIFRDPEKSLIAGAIGSRMALDAHGRIFMTLGDRGVHADAQRLGSVHGKIVRIERDGSVPADNPFVATPGANPAIWAIGFRDPQGIAVDPVTGLVWASDHGPAGGDEVNLIQRGHNYGWPVVSHGVDEGTGAMIGEGTEKAGMDEPAVWWGQKADEAAPPTGMTVLNSDRYPGWRGDLFVGTLWGRSMMRLELHGSQVIHQEQIFTNPFERLRDVEQGPDGWLYVVANRPDGSIIRLER
jgi:glucose/arabinose dehydrogenase